MAQLAIKREDEEQALKRRLFYDGHGSGEDKKLMSIVKSIAKLCLVEHQDDDFHKLHANIIKDIGIAISSADRQLMISEKCDGAVSDLEDAISRQEARIQEIKSDLSNLELELDYVDKLKKVSVYPDCQTTMQAIKEVQDKKNQLASKAVKYRHHLLTLMEACNILRKILEE